MPLFLKPGASRTSRVGLIVIMLASLGACSSVEKLVAGEKVDYRGSASRRAGLEVPPDLTQLSRDGLAPQPGGVVSASTFQQPTLATAAPTSAAVVPAPSADLRIERHGNERWLVTSMAPAEVWPKLETFWRDKGLALAVDDPQAGVMETEWAENRAKLPQDLIRKAVGGLLDSLYSTGEKDKFRTRDERTAKGSEIYVSHRGMVEVFSSATKDSTVWQARPSDPQLEAEFLQRIMVHLGAKEETAKTAVAAAAPDAPARARMLPNQPTPTLQVDDGFDRAWRRVGLALDRSGFTVVDRDRTQGIYFVRYVDPSQSGKEEPGFFAKLFGRKAPVEAPARYRVTVKGDGDRSTVQVLDSQGQAENGAAGRRIVALLVDDLK